MTKKAAVIKGDGTGPELVNAMLHVLKECNTQIELVLCEAGSEQWEKHGGQTYIPEETQKITGGSIAVKDPDTFERWIAKYGSGKIILGADAMNEKIAVSGWLEDSDEELVPFIKKYQEKGIEYVICTDISKDGMLQGPSFKLYEKILALSQKGLKLIASGGISTFDELPKLAELGCEGTIIGKAIYENRISLKQLENYILQND